MPLFGPEILKRFHYLALVAGRLGESPLLAGSRPRLPAGGTEVTGYREYVSGDDFYQVYWTWCARRDEMLVKTYQREADRHVHLLLDASASMAQGRPAKFQLARQIAAALGYVCLRQGWFVDAAAFSTGVLAALPRMRHRAKVPQLLRFLEQLQPGSGATDLRAAAEQFVGRGPRRGPVIVLSDLYDPAGFQPALEYLRFHGLAALVQIFDPHEVDPGLRATSSCSTWRRSRCGR